MKTARSNYPRAQIADRFRREEDLSRWFAMAAWGPIPDYFKRDWGLFGHPREQGKSDDGR